MTSARPNKAANDDRSLTYTYSKLLGVYASDIGWTPPIRYLLRRARVLKLLGNIPKASLLEVGCGSGALLCDATRLGFLAHGYETSTEAVSMARQLATLAASDHEISETPSAAWDGCFNVVCAFDVLEHIKDDLQALEDWTRWLAADGKLIISVPAHRSRWGDGDVWAGHWRRYDRNDILGLVERANLRATHFECYGFPLANLTERVGNHIYRRSTWRASVLSKEEATAASGVDRRSYSRLGGIIHSGLGRVAISLATALQEQALHTDWGSGYLLIVEQR